MPSFWHSMQSWFRDEKMSTAAQPEVHEVIVRTKDEIDAYTRWKSSGVCRLLVDWIDRQHRLLLKSPDNVDESIDFLRTVSSSGFVIHFSKLNYTRDEAVHTLDLFKERILTQLNYRSALSDKRIYMEAGRVITVQRHYLKPRLQFVEGEKMNQLYGNVAIELIDRNSAPYQLKLSATRYSDHMYSKGMDFGGLFRILTEWPEAS